MYNKKVEIPGININEIKTLTPKETITLFKELKKGNNEVKDLIVTGNIKLVLSILKRFKTTENNINDLFQVGCIGLLKAVDNFDPEIGVMFSTYAVPLILGEIRRANRDSKEIRVSRSIKELAYKILTYKEKYFNTYGIEPKNEEIAKKLNIEEYLIAYALNSLKDPISIYTPIYDDGGDTIYLLDQIENKKEEYDKDTLISLRKALTKINEREKNIIYSRYIIGKTQTELANEMNISQAQISRIESNAIKNIKKLIK